MLPEMKSRQRQVREAVAADRAPQLSFLPLISASALLFVFTKQFGNVRGYLLFNRSKKKNIPNQNVQRHMTAACMQTHTLPMRLTIYALMSYLKLRCK